MKRPGTPIPAGRTAMTTLVVSVFVSSVVPGHAYADDQSARRAALEARIAELAEELGVLRGEVAGRVVDRAGTAPPKTSETVLRRLPPDRVSTREAGEAGARAPNDVTDPELFARFAELAEARAGAELKDEISRQLRAGEAGFQVLHDFCRHIDRDKRLGTRFINDYMIIFGHAHHAMLDDVELARFAHFYLMASRDEPGSFMRRKFYDFVPVFVGYYPERFPELEAAFRADILERLDRRDADLRSVLSAAESLRFTPPAHALERLLLDAGTFQELGVVLDHLASRADEAGVTILKAFIDQRLGAPERVEVQRALNTLARMESLEAEALLERYSADGSGAVRRAATVAFYSVPRKATEITPALRVLSSDADRNSKRRLALGLRASNAAVWDALCASGELPPEVHDLCR